MSEDSPASLFVIECPACRAPFKMRGIPGQTGKAECPACLEQLVIDTERAVDGLDYATVRRISHLPTHRTTNPNPVRVRGSVKEEWMPGAPALKEVAFEQEISSVADQPKYDPNDPDRLRRRALARQQARARHVQEVQQWESETKSPIKMGRRAKKRAQRRQKQFFWIVGLCSLFMLTAAVFAFVVSKPLREKLANALEPAGPDLSVGVPIAGDVKRDFTLPSKDDYEQAISAIKRFVEAPTFEAAAEHIRHPNRVKPLMSSWHQKHPWQPLPLKTLPTWSELVVYKNIVVAQLEATDGSQRIAAAVKLPTGFEVDWESYVGWNEVDWDELPIKRPQNPVLLRVRIDSSAYFNYAFSDEDKWRCVRLATIDFQHILFGYVPRDSELFKTIEPKLNSSNLLLGMVKVRYPSDNPAPNQVEIVEWVEDGWVLRPNETE